MLATSDIQEQTVQSVTQATTPSTVPASHAQLSVHTAYPAQTILLVRHVQRDIVDPFVVHV